MIKTGKCIIEGCNRPYHGKGYCRYHYKKLVMKPRCDNIKCSVEGCNNSVSISFTKNKLCEMHGTRLKRNGSVEERKKERDIKSIIEILIKSPNPLEFEISNINTYSEITRLYYGDYCHKCGWNDGFCEAHHIIPKKEGGKSTINNTIILCPNCHSLMHRNKRHKRFADKTKEELEKMFDEIRQKE